MKKLVLILSLLAFLASTAAFAAADPTIEVSGKSVEAGETVEVSITVSSNPGVAFMRLGVEYDTDVLSLTGVKDGGILGSAVHSPDLTPYPYILFWNNGTAKSDFKSDGVIATLTFKVASDAPVGTYPITVSYDNDDDDIMNVNFEHIGFVVKNGGVTVTKKNYLYGDVTSDGNVNISDAIYMAQYIASDAIVFTPLQKIVADVFYDGAVNISDLIKLQQYLASPEVIVLGPKG